MKMNFSSFLKCKNDEHVVKIEQKNMIGAISVEQFGIYFYDCHCILYFI